MIGSWKRIEFYLLVSLLTSSVLHLELLYFYTVQNLFLQVISISSCTNIHSESV
jgi:hypothetical protein